MRPLRALATVAAATAVASCGSDDEPAGRSVTVGAGRPVEVTGFEYRFDPSAVTVEGAAGRPLRLTLRNGGALAHNLRVFRDDRELGGTPTFQAGTSRSAEVTLPAGEYRMVCTVGNHEELGMVGTLRVR